MQDKELFQEAFSTLKSNKLRTALAILGIVIGTMSVITLLSLGQSSQKAVESQIQSLGVNLLTISPGAQSQGGVRGQSGGGNTLKVKDYQNLIIENLEKVDSISPEVSRRFQLVAGANNYNSQVIGVLPVYLGVRNTEIFEGRFIESADENGFFAVIGPTLATNLFGEDNALGKTVRVQNKEFTIVGITKAKGGSGFQNPDENMYIPLQTAMTQIMGVDYLSSIAVKAKDASMMRDLQNELGYFLLSQHGFKDPVEADFTIFSQEDILSTASAVTSTFTTLLSGIAAISLLVGGIGIMNIMLVTVTERTREIGLRKALGATRKTIVKQFLYESIVLTFVGGIAGVILGVGLSVVISNLLHLPVTISLYPILVSLFVSCMTGIVFGYYPARKASRMLPIEALRYE